MVKHALLITIALAAFACGGKQGPTTPEPTGDNPTRAEPVEDTTMVSPDTMDQITRMFERKGPAVSRCLSIAVDNKELPKNSRGKVTLEVVISPAGTVGDVKVIKATLESQSLTDCVVNKVKEIQFPEVPKPYPTTYTYAFEAS